MRPACHYERYEGLFEKHYGHLNLETRRSLKLSCDDHDVSMIWLLMKGDTTNHVDPVLKTQYLSIIAREYLLQNSKLKFSKKRTNNKKTKWNFQYEKVLNTVFFGNDNAYSTKSFKVRSTHKYGDDEQFDRR